LIPGKVSGGWSITAFSANYEKAAERLRRIAVATELMSK
jgi:hypothetical protein